MKALRILVLLFCSATAALAFDDSDRAAVRDTVNTFLAEFEAGNWEVLDMPPGLINFVAYQQGMQPADLRQAMGQQTKAIMERVDSLKSVPLWDTLRPGTLPTGQSYAFLRMRVEMSIDGGPVQASESQNIVAQIDNDWYFVRIATAQTWDLFRAAYPEFKNVALP